MFSPVWIQAVMSIVVLAGVGLAVFGQVRWRANQEWESLASARAERITALEQQTQVQEIRINAQEGLIADVQRLNVELQRKLDRIERAKRKEEPGHDG